eukprot:CAMPEP_0184855424 /NCGR_PEP_ID=MMETSP0580-20130426/681_1 /TAXON_ID=1118495 /ORGANISM="Dactyliosolen fragilissimus" /LENGTH=250 /DNA_ID=CAMNT_0027349935 /DNA_START=270 /DNA_END=1019 /DNA_ORIENTATION=+
MECKSNLSPDNSSDSNIDCKAAIAPMLGRWPNPIIVVGLPKAGTTSLNDYFECGNSKNYTTKDGKESLKVSHWMCIKDKKRDFCGVVIQKNMKDPNQKDPLFNTGDFDVYTQLDNIFGLGYGCYFPQVSALEEMAAAHPNATFILNMRDVNDWKRSMAAWGTLDLRIDSCGMLGPTLGPDGKERSMDEKLETFYFDQIKLVREVVKKHAGIRLVEVTIDSPNAGEVLEENFGIPKQCWGQSNKNKKLSPE